MRQYIWPFSRMLSTELGLSKGWLLSWWLLFVLSTLYAKIKRKWVLINEIPQPLDHRRWRGCTMQMEQWGPPRARAPFQCTVSHAALTCPQHWSGVLFCSWLLSSLDVSCLTPPGPWWLCCYPPRQPIFLCYKLKVISDSRHDTGPRPLDPVPPQLSPTKCSVHGWMFSVKCWGHIIVWENSYKTPNGSIIPSSWDHLAWQRVLQELK